MAAPEEPAAPLGLAAGRSLVQVACSKGRLLAVQPDHTLQFVSPGSQGATTLWVLAALADRAGAAAGAAGRYVLQSAAGSGYVSAAGGQLRCASEPAMLQIFMDMNRGALWVDGPGFLGTPDRPHASRAASWSCWPDHLHGPAPRAARWLSMQHSIANSFWCPSGIGPTNQDLVRQQPPHMPKRCPALPCRRRAGLGRQGLPAGGPGRSCGRGPAAAGARPSLQAVCPARGRAATAQPAGLAAAGGPALGGSRQRRRRRLPIGRQWRRAVCGSAGERGWLHRPVSASCPGVSHACTGRPPRRALGPADPAPLRRVPCRWPAAARSSCWPPARPPRCVCRPAAWWRPAAACGTAPAGGCSPQSP